MKKIYLSGKYSDKFVLVDDDDYEVLLQWRWQAAGRNYEYAYRFTHIGSSKNGTRKQVSIPMHRFILSAPKNTQVDHINGNKLDNRKENLRLCNNSQNHQNKRITVKNKSGYKGVSYDNGKWRKKRWRSEIKANGKNIHIGYFDNAREAALAYNMAAKKYFGEFAYLNNL